MGLSTASAHAPKTIDTTDFGSNYIVATHEVVIPTPAPTMRPRAKRSVAYEPIPDVLAMTDAAGMPREAVECTIKHESGWNPKAYNGKNKDGSTDKGLWQINSSHKLPDSVTMDPIKSTEYAIELWKNKGFNPWVAYRKHCR